MLIVIFCILYFVNHLCTLYLYMYYLLVVVYRGPHGRLAFFSLNVLPSENKDYYYFIIIIIINCTSLQPDLSVYKISGQ